MNKQTPKIETPRKQGGILTRCGWRSRAWKASEVNTFSWTCFTTGLQITNKMQTSVPRDKEKGRRQFLSFSQGVYPWTYLGSSGISGLFLNSDEVLMPSFRSWFPSLAPAEDFLGENVFCAFPFKVLRVSFVAVFLAGRNEALLLRFAGGASLDAWHFLLVAAACCVVPKRKEWQEMRQSMKTDLRVKPDCPQNCISPCRDHYSPYVKQQFRVCNQIL